MRALVIFRPLGLTILLAATALMGQSHHPAVSHKKGIGESSQPGAIRTIRDLKVSWYYNWTPRPVTSRGPKDIQFIPMIWGVKNLDPEDLTAAKATGSDTLLGFNEPNERTQSNMTVQQALDAWPKLEALHMQLGSPASGTGDDVRPDGWLAQFMAGAKAKGLRVDFLCLHPYQSSFDPDQATKDLVQEVTTMHDRYHLPIWVTEYAMAKWGPPQRTPNAATQARFAAKSAEALQKLPFVERYAWYGDVPHQPTFSTNGRGGTPTQAGKAWAAAPEMPKGSR